jgi:hypothetical protein
MRVAASKLLVLITVAAQTTALAATTQPLTPQQILAEARASARINIEREMKGLASLGRRSLGQVIRFKLQDECLYPLCDLNVSDDAPYRVQLNELPGMTKVQVLTNRTLHSAGDQRLPQFYYRDVSVPGQIVVYTEVTSTLSYIFVSQSGESLDQSWSVQLRQPDVDGPPESVSLYIQIVPETTGADSLNEHVTALSLGDLCRTHPSETDQYVRPMFRLLRQEQSVFIVDERTAYQVFSPDLKTDLRIAAATDAAVGGLRADSYAEREAAMNALRRLGEPAAIYLMNTHSRPWSVEQAMRVDLFLAPYRPLSDEIADQCRSDPDFLLDCLYGSDVPIHRLALNQLRIVAGNKINFDPGMNGVAREDAIAKLRSTLSHP